MLAGPNRRDGSMVCLLVSQKTTLVDIHIVERRVDMTDRTKDELNRLETPIECYDSEPVVIAVLRCYWECRK